MGACPGLAGGFRKGTSLRGPCLKDGWRQAFCDACTCIIQCRDRESKVARGGARSTAVHRRTPKQPRFKCAPLRIGVGPIKEPLIDEVRRVSADVLVVGRSTKTGALDRLTDLTYLLVRDSPYPVVSV